MHKEKISSEGDQLNVFTKAIQISFLIGVILLAGGCSDSMDSVSEPVSLQFRVSTVALPAEGGTVIPPSGLVVQGTTLNIEATPNTGWAFDGWSGSIVSQENPLSLRINNNLDLTGNFRRIESIYRVSLSLSDDSGTLGELSFGQLEDPTSAGVPDAPPPPPSGVLSGWFERDGQRLFMDYRESLLLSASWQLHVDLGAGDELNLSWAIESELMEGSLRLFGPDGAELADMLLDSTGAVQLTLPSGKGVLNFEYEFE